MYILLAGGQARLFSWFVYCGQLGPIKAAVEGLTWDHFSCGVVAWPLLAL